MSYSEKNILNELKHNNQEVLKYMFDTYYEELLIYSIKFVYDKGIAEEIIQDIFIQIWNNRKKLTINRSIKAYLYTSVKNRSLNYLKSKYARIQFVEIEKANQKSTDYTIEHKIVKDEFYYFEFFLILFI